MADLGFLPGVTRILSATPASGQRLLFSATLDNGVDKLVKRFLQNEVLHSVDEANSPVAAMTHHVFTMTDADSKKDVVKDARLGHGSPHPVHAHQAHREEARAAAHRTGHPLGRPARQPLAARARPQPRGILVGCREGARRDGCRRPRRARRRRRTRHPRRPADRAQGVPAPLRPHGPRRRRGCRRHPRAARPGARCRRPAPQGGHHGQARARDAAVGRGHRPRRRGRRLRHARPEARGQLAVAAAAARARTPSASAPPAASVPARPARAASSRAATVRVAPLSRRRARMPRPAAPATAPRDANHRPSRQPPARRVRPARAAPRTPAAQAKLRSARWSARTAATAAPVADPRHVSREGGFPRGDPPLPGTVRRRPEWGGVVDRRPRTQWRPARGPDLGSVPRLLASAPGRQARAARMRIRGDLADHDGGGVGVPADDGGHHRRVGDAQTLHPADAELRVDDGCGIRPHSGSPDGVVERVRIPPERQLGALGRRHPLAALGLDPVVGRHRAQGVGVDEPLAFGEAGEDRRLVEPAGIGQVARIDHGLRARIGRRQPDRATAARAQQDGADGESLAGKRNQSFADIRRGGEDDLDVGESRGHAGTLGHRRAHEPVRFGHIRGQHPASRRQVPGQLPEPLGVEQGARRALPARGRRPGGPGGSRRPRGRRPGRPRHARRGGRRDRCRSASAAAGCSRRPRRGSPRVERPHGG